MLMEGQVAFADNASDTGAVELMHPAHLMHVRLKAGIISNGEATRHRNGVAETHPTCTETNRDITAAVNGRSHAVNRTESPDHLVERAIQCLDEKV